jgi:hypothetical protein
VIVIVIENVFNSKIYQNNIFLYFFKIILDTNISK